MNVLYIMLPGLLILIVALVVYGATLERRQHAKRRAFIEQYAFPAALRAKILFKHSNLSENQMFQVLQGLKQFFLICLAAKAVQRKRSFGMPSKIVDDAWHEFILISREYSRFCEQAFGGYLHHTPAGASSETHDQALLRTYHQMKTSNVGVAGWAMLGGVPLLFALDKALAVEGGQHYDQAAMAELEQKRQHMLQSGGDASIDASSSHGDGRDSSSDGGGGGGDGGGGCGGGGCGS